MTNDQSIGNFTRIKTIMRTSMKKFHTIPVLVLLALLAGTSLCAFNNQLVQDYLLYTNVRTVLFITDEFATPIELMEESRNLQTDGMWINHWNAVNGSDGTDFDYDHFYLRTSHQICVVINLASNQTPAVLREISQRNMFHFERSWLMFDTDNQQSFSALSQENVNVDAQISNVIRIDDNEYQIVDIYNPSFKRHGRLRVDKIGSWSQTMGLKMIEEKTKIQRRGNLGGVTFLSAIAIPRLPANTTLMEHLNSNENTHLDSSSKNNFRMYQYLTEMYNFKLLIHRSTIWGARTPNGTWIGALGMINRSEVDICISGVRWEIDRYGAFEQTTNGYYVRVLFLFRHPRSLDTKKIFLAPFDIVVWTLIILTGLAIAIQNDFVVLIQKYMKITPTEDYHSNSFFDVSGIILQQAYSLTPMAASSRVLALTSLVFSLFIYQFYGSFIVGALLTEPPRTIKTMQQLYNSKLDVASDDVAYTQDIFKYVQEEWTAKLYERVMEQPKPLLPVYAGLSQVKKGYFAINTDGNYAYKILKTILTDREACDLQEINFVPKTPTGSPLPNKSPLKEMIKIGIRKLYETGMLSYQWKIWIGHKPKCAESIDVVAVDLMHFSSALYVLGIGMQISIALLLGELFVFQRFIRSCLVGVMYKLRTPRI